MVSFSTQSVDSHHLPRGRRASHFRHQAADFARGRRGGVAVVAGSLSLRDHGERLIGVQQIITSEYPNLDLPPTVERRDGEIRNADLNRRLLAGRPDLTGPYTSAPGRPASAMRTRVALPRNELIIDEWERVGRTSLFARPPSGSK